MGGCASKPKEFETRPEALPTDPTTPKNAEGETVAPPQEEKSNEGENQNEAPLIDVSEPKEEAESKAAEAAPAEAPAAVAQVVTEKPEEKKVEVAEEVETVNVEAAKEPKEEVQEAKPKAQEEEVQEVKPKAQEEEKKEEIKPKAAPTSEDKTTEAPLVTL